MSRTTTRPLAIAAAIALLASACTGPSELAADVAGDGANSPADESSLMTMPPVVDTTTTTDPAQTASRPVDATTVAVINTDGQLGIVRDGAVSNNMFKFTAFPSPDRSTAVLTLGPHIQGIGPERPVLWVGLPDGVRVAEQTMRTGSELTATSLDGTFAGFTTRAGEPIGDAIAGVRRTSEIEIISRDDGTVFSQTLDGNFVPEAFSRTTNADGVPSLVFLLEYFPADAPRFYRVRVLSTETGEVSLPLNLRDKSQQIDERMAGLSRSQVVAEEHGLLFTLYRGTIDGTPDGEPYAFVHTLDFADGVWCLEVDPRLELDRVLGSLAAGGDRLYVASANGTMGSYPIPSLSDPNRSPTMDWVVDVTREADRAPVLLADEDGVWIGPDDPVSRLVRLNTGGDRGDPIGLPSSSAMALASGADGEVHAIGADWATFDVGDRPDWLGEIAYLVVG